jgi:nucleoside-diphosphate-sugar epimerase
VKPTPTGKIIVDFLKGEMPAFLETGLNWVHVRDVAQGHILAAEKGRIGERYILGHAEGNWMMKDTFTVLADNVRGCARRGSRYRTGWRSWPPIWMRPFRASPASTPRHRWRGSRWRFPNVL